MNNKLYFWIVAVALLAVFGGATYVYRAEQAQQAAQLAARNRDALLRFSAPTMGNAQAPVHIVEFLDPVCETCAALYPMVKQLMANNPEKIRLTIRYAPLHRGAADIVRLLEASRKQGRFWEALETLLRTQAQWTENDAGNVERALAQLGSVGLDLQRLKADMASPEVDRILQQDVRDARTLQVTKTPEYFVNGRPLPRFGFDQLVALVKEELHAASSAK